MECEELRSGWVAGTEGQSRIGRARRMKIGVNPGIGPVRGKYELPPSDCEIARRSTWAARTDRSGRTEAYNWVLASPTASRPCLRQVRLLRSRCLKAQLERFVERDESTPLPRSLARWHKNSRNSVRRVR